MNLTDIKKGVVCCALFALAGCDSISETFQPSEDFFSTQVAPIFERKCVRCHNLERTGGELSLVSRDDFLQGGESGPAFVSGKPAESLLIEMVSGDDPSMPAEGDPLTADEIATLESWVSKNAAWPASVSLEDRWAEDDKWWSLQAVKQIQPPKFASNWIKTPVDAFVYRRLQESDLTPSPPAGKRELLRRVTFDLIGLPPTPDEIDNFVADRSPTAFEKVFERLLDSPHYGERWARHWLDVAHYADTHGFERDMKRPNAWRYRDYVVDAFNSDKPYDDFLREQVVGDLTEQDNSDSAIATGFLAAGPWDYVSQVYTGSDRIRRRARAEDMDDIVTTVMNTAVGLTVQCARCHDHKFDPISQEDYYRLCAIFFDVGRSDRDISTPDEESVAAELRRLIQQICEVDEQIVNSSDKAISLDDIVAGGDGTGTGTRGNGIDPRNGRPTDQPTGMLEQIETNAFIRSANPFVDGVVIPNGAADGVAAIPITSTGLCIDLPPTSARCWDYITNRPARGLRGAELSDVNYNDDGHTMLSIHANSAITFDLDAIRVHHNVSQSMRLRGIVGLPGEPAIGRADVRICVDGEIRLPLEGLTPQQGGVPLNIAIEPHERFLSFVVTDGGNGIYFDQVFFGDAQLIPVDSSDSGDTSYRREQDVLLRRYDDLMAQLSVLLPSHQPRYCYAMTPQSPRQIHVLKRGNAEHRGKAVRPATLPIFKTSLDHGETAGSATKEPRLMLANWLTDCSNPLTRRVIVNRIWHYHFGQGIVRTPSNFGKQGDAPSHPELLDWLAGEFVERGWSIKQLHRLIVTSSVYQQSSAYRPDAHRVDAENRLLWRMNRRRIEAESIRDSVLAVSGTLNEQMTGPGFEEFWPINLYDGVFQPVESDDLAFRRRSVYRFVVRGMPDEFLHVLDCPDMSRHAPKRNTTTTALQALAMLNDSFMIRQSRLFAARVEREAGADPIEKTRLAFRLTFAREPTETELDDSVLLVSQHGLFTLCRMLLNANEFVYID